jgi:hypothetical protein
VIRLALAVIVLNLFLLGLLSWQRYDRQVAPPSYGQSMPQWLAEAQRTARERGAEAEIAEAGSGPHWQLVLYAHRAPPEPLTRYLSVLMQRFRDRGEGLQVALVLGAEHRAETDPTSIQHDGYSLLLDSEGRVRRQLDIPSHTAWTFLVAPDGHLAFSAAGLISRDELRQHLEKHLLGRIEYARTRRTLGQPNSRLQPYRVVDARAERGDGTDASYLPPPNTTVIVLPASLCGTCNPTEIYDRIASFHKARCADAERACRLQILATAGYPIEDLLWQLEVRSLAELSVFRATEKLEGLEDEYFTKRSGGEDAWVVTLGTEREVLEIHSLGQIMEESDEA